MPDLTDVIGALAEHKARVVIVGGVALQLQGSAYITQDVDFAYERTRENAQRIVDAIGPLRPRPRGSAPELPFVFDAQTLLTSQTLTLTTTAGDVDLLANITGIGPFDAVDALAETFTVAGHEVRVLSIEGLLVAKRAAARPKDAPGIIELEALRNSKAILDSEASNDR
jgi:predicted nucleotidyltransferase